MDEEISNNIDPQFMINKMLCSTTFALENLKKLYLFAEFTVYTGRYYIYQVFDFDLNKTREFYLEPSELRDLIRDRIHDYDRISYKLELL